MIIIFQITPIVEKKIEKTRIKPFVAIAPVLF